MHLWEEAEVYSEEILIAIQYDMGRFIQSLKVPLKDTLVIAIIRHHFVLNALKTNLLFIKE